MSNRLLQTYEASLYGLRLDTPGKHSPLPWGEGGDPAVAGEPGEGLLLQIRSSACNRPLTRLRAEAAIVSGSPVSLRRAQARPAPAGESAGSGTPSPISGVRWTPSGSGNRTLQGREGVKKSTTVILSVAKDLSSCFCFKDLRTTVGMLRCAQHDRIEFFHTFRGQDSHIRNLSQPPDGLRLRIPLLARPNLFGGD